MLQIATRCDESDAERPTIPRRCPPLRVSGDPSIGENLPSADSVRAGSGETGSPRHPLDRLDLDDPGSDRLPSQPQHDVHDRHHQSDHGRVARNDDAEDAASAPRRHEAESLPIRIDIQYPIEGHDVGWWDRSDQFGEVPDPAAPRTRRRGQCRGGIRTTRRRGRRGRLSRGRVPEATTSMVIGFSVLVVRDQVVEPRVAADHHALPPPGCALDAGHCQVRGMVAAPRRPRRLHHRVGQPLSRWRRVGDDDLRRAYALRYQ